MLELSLSRVTHRKLFHILAFALYTPMHASLLNNRKMFEFLVLSQNCVTVLFIYIELLRYNNQGNMVGDALNKVFGCFVDGRE